MLRRVARKALEPMLEAAKAAAPVDEGYLRDSIMIASGPLTQRARRAERGLQSRGVKMFLGTAARTGVTTEFGTYKQAAQPFMRPAWDAHKDADGGHCRG